MTGRTTDAIRPFYVSIPEERLKDLRRRIVATQWPEQELVSDASQGVQLATMKKLAEYWTTYDWRKTEAKLNSYPQGRNESGQADDRHTREARFLNLE